MTHKIDTCACSLESNKAKIEETILFTGRHTRMTHLISYTFYPSNEISTNILQYHTSKTQFMSFTIPTLKAKQIIG